MLSTCPECRTTFRVSQAQLDARRGLVRCGRCNAVFNAYDALLPELEAPPLGEEGEAVVQTRVGGGDDDVGAAPATPSWSAPEGPASVPAEPEPSPAQAEAGPPEAPPLRWIPSEGAETPESILLSELPVRRPSSGAPLRALWIVLLVPLGLLLPLQLAYFLRAEIAAWIPETRPYLEAACAPLGCTVALPRDREALRVEASSLETDPESPASAQLRVAFSNRAGQAVAWPHIVLTLTDVGNVPVAQRVFAPKEYLPRQQADRPGLEAGGEYEAWLDLGLGGLTAAGYRVALEYP